MEAEADSQVFVADSTASAKILPLPLPHKLFDLKSKLAVAAGFNSALLAFILPLKVTMV